MKIVFYSVFLAAVINSAVFSQNIDNILGTGGTFTIKDNSQNYFTLSQSSGYVNILKSLRLENTTNATTGIIFKGTDRFIHNRGDFNTFLGINSGSLSSSSDENTGFGYGTLSVLGGTGLSNTAVGYNSLTANTFGDYNTAVGNLSLSSNTTGIQNTAIGSLTLKSIVTGTNNTAIGYASMELSTAGNYNIALGSYSLQNNSGSNNIGIGYLTQKNSSGSFNVSIGDSSLSGTSLSGSGNTAVGRNTLKNVTTGINNTVLGSQSGTTITTGSNNTIIGYNAQSSSATVSNQITLGNSSVNSLRCNVTSITSLSDRRDKKNINDLSLGLNFLMKLKPREFTWDKREWYENGIPDGSKSEDHPTAGFIAQELDEVQQTENAQWLNLVLKDNPEKLEATYGNLLPVIVKAVQELKEENDQLKEKNDQLAEENMKLKEILLHFEKMSQAINEKLDKKSNSDIKETWFSVEVENENK